MTVHPPINEFGLTISSVVVGSVQGTSVTPGNNTYGSYTELIAGAAVTEDAYGIWLYFTSVFLSGSARDCLAKIGIDPAGGSSYADWITDLYVSGASFLSATGLGISYYFPLHIRAGTSIACAMSVNNATVGTGAAFLTLKCRPTGPVVPRVGQFVRTFGSTPASSSGTALTVGNGAKGSYVQLGSALAEPLWWWCLGAGYNNANQNNNPQAWDLAIGDATNKRIVVPDQLVIPSSAEALSYISPGAPAMGAIGDLVYARALGTSPTTGWSAIAYGVGG